MVAKSFIFLQACAIQIAFSSPRNPIVDQSVSADARFTIPSNSSSSSSFTRFFIVSEIYWQHSNFLLHNLYQSNNLFLINLISQRHLKKGRGIVVKGEMCCRTIHQHILHLYRLFSSCWIWTRSLNSSQQVSRSFATNEWQLSCNGAHCIPCIHPFPASLGKTGL